MGSRLPLPNRLKEARNAAGLSQKQLGIKAGIDEFSSSARMNQYETGKHIPDFSTLTKIANVLKVPPCYFYAEDELLAKILIIYQTMNKAQKEKLLKSLQKKV